MSLKKHESQRKLYCHLTQKGAAHFICEFPIKLSDVI